VQFWRQANQIIFNLLCTYLGYSNLVATPQTGELFTRNILVNRVKYRRKYLVCCTNDFMNSETAILSRTYLLQYLQTCLSDSINK